MIVAHNSDYEVFTTLINQSVTKLQAIALNYPDLYLHSGGVKIEKDVFDIVKEQAQGTLFENNIEMISGQRFPDIVAYVNKHKAYGLEVKTTNSNKWKSTGSSIFEGTRVEDVGKIHLLFAKLSDPIEFRHREYQQCLYDVAITHSPRYLIDMETRKGQTIFEKIGIEYDTFRTLENPFTPIKKYFRTQLKAGEDLWWMGTEEESSRGFGIRAWDNLSSTEKTTIKIHSLAYFPSLLGNDRKKYVRLATWLVANHSVVNHALRDTFTAGGQANIKGVNMPKMSLTLSDHLTEVLACVNTMPNDDCAFYWGVNVNSITAENKVNLWKAQCLQHCQKSLNSQQHNIITDILS